MTQKTRYFLYIFVFCFLLVQALGVSQFLIESQSPNFFNCNEGRVFETQHMGLSSCEWTVGFGFMEFIFTLITLWALVKFIFNYMSTKIGVFVAGVGVFIFAFIISALEFNFNETLLFMDMLLFPVAILIISWSAVWQKVQEV